MHIPLLIMNVQVFSLDRVSVAERDFDDGVFIILEDGLV